MYQLIIHRRDFAVRPGWGVVIRVIGVCLFVGRGVE